MLNPIELRTWTGVRYESVVVNFCTIEPVALPLLPAELPKSVRLINHAEWIKTRKLIVKDWGTASFEELDLKVLDLKLLEKTTGCEFGDKFIPYLDRRDYLEWSESFDEAWGELECEIEKLFESACASKAPTTIGNRVMPPSLEDALRMMLAEA